MGNEQVFAKTFDGSQIRDCQRSPAFPESGKVFTARGFKLPYRSSGVQFTTAELDGIRFQFKYDSGTKKLALYFKSASGEQKLSNGEIYGIGDKEFLFVAELNGYGYIITTEPEAFSRNEIKYTPKTGKATLEQITELLKARGIFAQKFDSSKVFDCQRSPAFPAKGKPFSASYFTLPYGPNRQFKREDLVGRYFKFEYSIVKGKVDLYIHNADGTKFGDKISTGEIYALDKSGFLYVGNGHYGYFFLNSANYVPEMDKATYEQLENYKV